MTRDEATVHAEAMERIGLTARVVRILPPAVDPASDDDNGWDVEVTNIVPGQ